MRKLKEVLRLHFLGLSQHQIARSCSISQSTVHEYLSAAQAAGVKWPAPENWDDQQIERTLFPQRPAPAIWRKHPEPEWTQIHQELQTHKDLTLQLVWQEGRESNPDGYGYSRYVVARLMFSWNAGFPACPVSAGTHRNINRSPAGPIGL